MPTQAQAASPAAYALIREFEGLRTECYLCPAGIATIGYGHTGPEVETGMRSISLKEADDMLQADVRRCTKQVAELVRVPINQNQFDALVSFVFNLGAASPKSSTLLRILNSGQNPRSAATEFLRWVQAKNPKTGKSEVLPGLVRRREAEKALFLGGVS